MILDALVWCITLVFVYCGLAQRYCLVISGASRLIQVLNTSSTEKGIQYIHNSTCGRTGKGTERQGRPKPTGHPTGLCTRAQQEANNRLDKPASRKRTHLILWLQGGGAKSYWLAIHCNQQ
ncbi:hypothetical protein COO60DRAFT_769397 [Scenedesmus sp. NREL 46B-D3]|nr:hypothetical protein COO60DRAFT_769397 [Scenedesmus sp. NREL 46B-D3]